MRSRDRLPRTICKLYYTLTLCMCVCACAHVRCFYSGCCCKKGRSLVFKWMPWEKYTRAHTHTANARDNKPWMKMVCARVDPAKRFSAILQYANAHAHMRAGTRACIHTHTRLCVICNHSFRQQLLFTAQFFLRLLLLACVCACLCVCNWFFSRLPSSLPS